MPYAAREFNIGFILYMLVVGLYVWDLAWRVMLS